MIYLANRRRKEDSIKKEFPNVVILDLTSKSPYRSGMIFSPFFPHGNIPIPFTLGETATSVEAIWQGLKVFENADVDISHFNNVNMKGLKRTSRKYGRVLGHRKGLYSDTLLNYYDARVLIYLPTYKWVLENVIEVQKTLIRIKDYVQTHDLVLLDYNVNVNINDISTPLSHAGLVKLYLEGRYPEEQTTKSILI